jgi:hypothetical protein
MKASSLRIRSSPVDVFVKYPFFSDAEKKFQILPPFCRYEEGSVWGVHGRPFSRVSVALSALGFLLCIAGVHFARLQTSHACGN